MQKSGSDPLIGEGVWQLFGGLAGRSAPSLSKTLACNLREYSSNRSRLKQERSQTTKDFTLEKIDLAGGNGRWRQRKAKVEFARQEIEEKELRREAKILELERSRRKADKERERRDAEKRDLEKRKQEREQARREADERERTRLAAEEAEQQRKQQEHEEWLRRQPHTCGECHGSGKCQGCGGKGYEFTMFLVPVVSASKKMEHGKVMQGCEMCGGLRHNIVGDLRIGHGKCTPCDGVGKVTPVVTEVTGRHRRKHLHLLGDSFAAGSSVPASPLTPMPTWG